MKLQFLGTGAADWEASAERNAEYRRFSSTLIDDELLIDPGPFVPESIETFGIDPSKIKYIINTHRHMDHYNEEVIAWLTQKGAKFIDFAEGEIKNVGKYEIEAVKGNHGAIPTNHFFIDDGEKRLFYALDSAWLLAEEITAIKRKFVHLAVLDGTIGDAVGDYRIFEHCNLRMLEEMKSSLVKYIDKFIITHMARTLHTDHQTLKVRMAKSGIEVAYDGMILKI